MSPSLLQSSHLTEKQIQTIQNPLAQLTASPELKHPSPVTPPGHFNLPQTTPPPPTVTNSTPTTLQAFRSHCY
ncbi:hypothetical protein TNIN_334261 [Trichonephila inaurata madagascariensis]|uniref:Uncharacterized protein n=1 Tax=Trichonephila inaurata madagascariensis TaxID=2747483 RepID=A0A8X7C974_9ARAC|nr:hypothetical protein TNIN_334261 [Trichonephila inaurata madagascariensis]